MMEGYYGRERHETFDEEGWYHSGDLVTVDDDGFVYFKGRHGDMIKTSGANVSPREVERAIADLFGFRALVVGIDDEDRGQAVAAIVIESTPGQVDPEDVRSELSTRLSAYKVPRHYRVIAEGQLPMLSSGKPDLRAVKALFDGA